MLISDKPRLSFLLMLISSLALIQCQQIAETNKHEAANEDWKVLESRGRPLDLSGKDSEPRLVQKSTTYHDPTGDIVIYVLFVAVMILILIIKCCIEWAKKEVEEDTRTLVGQQIPAASRLLAVQSTRLPCARPGSRPLAPPRTSTSALIIPPYGTEPGGMLFTVENPNYRPVDNSLRPRPRLETPLLDLPPGYDEVVAEDKKRKKSSKGSDSPPPEYS